MTALPQKVGKYHVLGIAGRGNMGIVYTGYDPFSDRNVAIKVCKIEEDSYASRRTRKLFFNEAHTAGALDHPNIITVLDAGEQNGQPYIVMEYIEGGKTLKSYCEFERLLPFKKVAELIHACAKALDYAHRRGVIHRDIKPKNILLSRSGTVKIGDFGIAQRAMTETTQIMGILGSPLYMSPEQIRQDVVNAQTDLYSLGVVMFELLTGKPPFNAQGLTQLLDRILHEDPPSLKEFRPQVPESFEHVISCALSKDLADRYTMGRELASDLSAIFPDLEQSDDDLSDDEKFRTISELHFFSEFSSAEVWEIIRASRWERYSPGEPIITEGSLDLEFYIIVSGDAVVMKSAQPIKTFTKGDCFGELGYLSNSRRAASIIANGEVSLLKITAAMLEHISVTCRVQFQDAFIRTLIARLVGTNEVLTTLACV
jgi:serine/threonine protein kinase